jgi:hypothetical protein
MGIRTVPYTVSAFIWRRTKSSINSSTDNNNCSRLNTNDISHDIHEVADIESLFGNILY